MHFETCRQQNDMPVGTNLRHKVRQNHVSVLMGKAKSVVVFQKLREVCFILLSCSLRTALRSVSFS